MKQNNNTSTTESHITSERQLRPYQAPDIETVCFDNEISLILSSPAPPGDDDSWTEMNDSSKNDPFKIKLG